MRKEIRLCEEKADIIFPGYRSLSVSREKLGKRRETGQHEMILLGDELDQEVRLVVRESYWYCPIIELALSGKGACRDPRIRSQP